MTLEQATMEINSVERKCKGPYRILPIQRRVRELIQQRRFEEAIKFGENKVRKGCGADINPHILLGSLDGQQHGYVCDICGITDIYVAPSIQIDPVVPDPASNLNLRAGRETNA